MQTRLPPHPASLLKPLMVGRSVRFIAKHLRVSRGYLSRFLREESNLKADMALRLHEAFGLDAALLLNLRDGQRLWVASRKKRAKLKPLEFKKAA